MSYKEELEDIIIKCRDCGNDFPFEPGEQRFYADRDYSQPVRCISCRKKKKESNERKNNEGFGKEKPYNPWNKK